MCWMCEEDALYRAYRERKQPHRQSAPESPSDTGSEAVAPPIEAVRPTAATGAADGSVAADRVVSSK